MSVSLANATDATSCPQLRLLEEVNRPLWIYRYAPSYAYRNYRTAKAQSSHLLLSCGQRRNIWANKAALILFNKSPQEFLSLQYSSPSYGAVSKDDFATFIALNDLVHQEVEVCKHKQTTKRLQVAKPHALQSAPTWLSVIFLLPTITKACF